MGGPAAGAAPLGLHCRVRCQVSQRSRPWVGDVRTMRHERAAGPVVDKRTHQASRPLRSGARRPILQSGKLRPTAVLHWPAEKVGKPEVTSSEAGDLFSPEHGLNWAGTSPGRFPAAVVSVGGWDPLPDSGVTPAAPSLCSGLRFTFRKRRAWHWCPPQPPFPLPLGVCEVPVAVFIYGLRPFLSITYADGRTMGNFLY